MTLFVLAQLFYISLHVEKNEKGTKIREKKSRKLSVWLFNFQVCDIFGIRKNIQKNQKLPGHF